MNTKIKAEKRIVEFKLITRECLAFLVFEYSYPKLLQQLT